MSAMAAGMVTEAVFRPAPATPSRANRPTGKVNLKKQAAKMGRLRLVLAAAAAALIVSVTSLQLQAAGEVQQLFSEPWPYTRQGPVNVCLMAAEYWGLPTAGGTATAFEQLALALAGSPRLNVTFVGGSMQFEHAERARVAHSALPPNLHFELLDKERHFAPLALKVQQCHPYEQIGLASLLWLQQNQERCDVVHVHEWGGVYSDLLTVHHFGGFRPGLAVVVQQHGGHFWSTQDDVRPTDVTSLRIDAREKVGMELADAVLAPTQYIFDWYAQRGWKVPKTTAIMANALGALEDHAPRKPTAKPVWRVAFFGRLEERKGLKLFVEAVEGLPPKITGAPKFEVVVVGAESRVDEQASSPWLAARTANWTWPVHVHSNVPRVRALKLIRGEGILLALCSIVENAPYAVAEASAYAIPYIAFDVGGVREILEPSDSVIPFSSDHAVAVVDLRAALRSRLVKGTAKAAPLSKLYRHASKAWREWHELSRLEARSASRSLAQRGKDWCSPLHIIATNERLPAQELQHKVCRQGSSSDTMLLLPEEFRFFPKRTAWASRCRLFEDDFEGGVTFGSWLPDSEEAAFAYSPTWIMYESHRAAGIAVQRCTTEIPIMLKRHTFCSTYHAYARNFQTYSSWGLALSLKQAGTDLLTFPEVLFNMKKWNSEGNHCYADRLPALRINHQVASNLRGDPQYELLRQLAPSATALADMMQDLGTTGQSSRPHGWEFAFGDSPLNSTLLQYWYLPDRPAVDAVWACPGPGPNPYPHYSHNLLHPCSTRKSEPTRCCGSDYAPVHAQYRSWFQLENVFMVLSFEVMPSCGDGLSMAVGHTRSGENSTTVLQSAAFDVSATATHKQLTFHLDRVGTNDLLSLSVYPNDNHNCDGLYISKWQIWRGEDAAQFSLSIL